MKLTLEKIGALAWQELAGNAHKIVFDEVMPPEYDRIDYVLYVYDADCTNHEPLGYITVREFDAETAYLKHGGAFPRAVKSVYAWKALQMCLTHLKSRYKRITTLVENDNTSYLRMALTAGFRVIGVRVFQGIILLELFLGGDGNGPNDNRPDHGGGEGTK